MTANAQPAAPGAPAQSGIGLALIAGRIELTTRKSGQNGVYFLTLVKMAAPDEYTSPSTVEVLSREKLGERGETWRGKVRISGYPRSYKTTDQDTGEVVQNRTANVRLEVVQ